MKRRVPHLLRTLESRRLTLVAASAQLLEADLSGKAKLAAALAVEEPDDWPPQLYESTAVRVALEQLRDPAEQGWSIWYLLSRKRERPRLVGIAEFKGKPDADGVVEISYSVLRQFRIQGYATEAVARLVVWAFSHEHVVEVCAETMPHMKKSIRVLEKNGFKFAGPGSEQGVVRYVVQKSIRR